MKRFLTGCAMLALAACASDPQPEPYYQQFSHMTNRQFCERDIVQEKVPAAYTTEAGMKNCEAWVQLIRDEILAGTDPYELQVKYPMVWADNQASVIFGTAPPAASKPFDLDTLEKNLEKYPAAAAIAFPPPASSGYQLSYPSSTTIIEQPRTSSTCTTIGNVLDTHTTFCN